MITVHHLEKSRSHRVIWLLEELGLAYRIESYQRDPDTFLAPPALKTVHPLGKSPVVTLNGQVLAESGAIAEYLVETHPDSGLGIPPGDNARQDYLYWLHYAEGSLMPLLVMKLVFSRVSRSPMPFFARPVAKRIVRATTRKFIHPQLETHFGYLENWLEGRDWLAGERFTAADIQMSYPLEAAAGRSGMGGRYPALQAYLERLRDRPAYRKAIELGGTPTL